MFDLTGKLALVTGAGQNIGQGIARHLAGRGASVVVNDVRAERAEATVAAITRAQGTAFAAPFDVTDLDCVVAAVAGAVDRAGAPIDILVNNAGNGGANGMAPSPFRTSDPASWRGPIDVNLYGVLNCTHSVIDGMCARRWGRVITIASGAGLVGLRIGVSAYGAGKGGAISFMRHLAVETARDGVTANSIALGLMGGVNDPDSQMARQIPVGRLGTPDDVGAYCVYLASPEASWMTGQTVHLNGGAVTD